MDGTCARSQQAAGRHRRFANSGDLATCDDNPKIGNGPSPNQDSNRAEGEDAS